MGGNLTAGRQGGPLGGTTNQSGSFVAPSGTLPRANANGPAQSISLDLAVDRYIKQFLVTKPFLGIDVTVHKLLRPYLDAVETALDYATNQQRHGITSMRGYQGPYSGLHSVGFAIDFNYETSPYLMREKGERTLDVKLVEVYNRIARFVLGRDSVIPRGITLNPNDKSLYNSLKQESDAMGKYFGLFMREPDTFLVPYLATPDGSQRSRTTTWLDTTAASVPTSTNALRQIQQDWVLLTGTKSGPQILLPGEGGSVYRDPCTDGLCYPEPIHFDVDPGVKKKRVDAPFEGRDPAKGFLNFDYEIASALMDHGFTWGAIGFGGGANGSGDVMHFELSALGRKVQSDAESAVSASI